MHSIQNIAIFGAGVMGAQIAAHCANAGFLVKLYDLETPLVEKALLNLKKLKPAPLASLESLNFIQAKNYQNHLAELKDIDLVIEAVAERLDIKKSLYEKAIPHLNKNAYFATNTSGLNLETLAASLPDAWQNRFCGVHFFNPPRYMKLAELIPTEKSCPKMLDNLETFLTSYLGKGVIRAKDTPNFIANRVGVFSLLATIYHAEKFDIPFDVVDALTGPLIGRPKSATFRTLDVVGLDTMAHVIDTMKNTLKDCPWHAFYQKPKWLLNLIEQGKLGQKTRSGIYQKVGKTIQVLDNGSYRDAASIIDDEVKAIFKDKSQNTLLALANASSKQANFLAACFLDCFHYASYHLEIIADTTRDVDCCLKWGFGWQQGPFEFWQSMGFSDILNMLKIKSDDKTLMSDAPLPQWLNNISAFYDNEFAYSPIHQNFKAPSDLAVYQKQISVKGSEVLFEDDCVILRHQKDDIGILSFKTKMNTISSQVLSGLNQALDIANEKVKAIVLWQEDRDNFSCGANLAEFMEHLKKDDNTHFKKMVANFQKATKRMKYNPIPIISAISGRAFGGGCELLQHTHHQVAAMESYIGLVEAGVGLLPAGGGLKALVYDAYEKANGKAIYPYIEDAFKTVAMAKVSMSAKEAKDMGLLRQDATIILNSDELLFVAKEKAKQMVSANFTPPREYPIKALGINELARLKMIITNMQQGQFISEHDAIIASHIASVLCGGEVDEGSLIDENWLLKLEIDAFATLGLTEKTQDRITHMLKTKRPLRN